MPEGDTIYRAARALNGALAGRRVVGFETALAKIARVNDDTPIVGRVVERVESRGKWCLMWFSAGVGGAGRGETEPVCLVTHMLMSGSWHLYRVGERWRAPKRAMRVVVRVGSAVVDPTHAMEPREWGIRAAVADVGSAVVDFTHAMEPREWGTRAAVAGRKQGPSGDSGQAPGCPDEDTLRRNAGANPTLASRGWGTRGAVDHGSGGAAVEDVGWEAVAFNVPVVEWHTVRSLERNSQVPRLGPDLLAGEFTVEGGVARLEEYGREHPEAEVGVVLLNQRVLAGLGNVYKSEVAFAARVNPWRRMSTVSREEMDRMVEFSLRYMKANVADGKGDGIVTYSGNRRTTGRMDREERLWVYGRQGQECRRCGTLVMMRKQGEQARSTYWCQVCQPWVGEETAPVGNALAGRRRKASC